MYSNFPFKGVLNSGNVDMGAAELMVVCLGLNRGDCQCSGEPLVTWYQGQGGDQLIASLTPLQTTGTTFSPMSFFMPPFSHLTYTNLRCSRICLLYGSISSQNSHGLVHCCVRLMMKETYCPMLHLTSHL